MQLNDELKQKLKMKYKYWLNLIHEKESSLKNEEKYAEIDQEKEVQEIQFDIENEEVEEWYGIMNNEDDEEEWIDLETDESQGIDGNIEAKSMSENLMKDLHVIWKHWQDHFDKSLKYYIKIK